MCILVAASQAAEIFAIYTACNYSVTYAAVAEKCMY